MAVVGLDCGSREGPVSLRGRHQTATRRRQRRHGERAGSIHGLLEPEGAVRQGPLDGLLVAWFVAC